MKKLRSVLCTLLVACFITSLVSAAAVDYGAENNPNQKEYSQIFSDVPLNHWAFRYIADLVDRKAINGFPDGKFYPDNTVTRQEFAKIMVIAAGLTPTAVKTATYVDVPTTHWASPFVEAASSYLTAYRNSVTGEMNFKPTAGALREDIAVAVVKLRGYDARLADLSLLDTMFSDVAAISAAARPYVALAVENEIISGYSDGTFRAQNTIARSEAAAILWRAFQYGSDEKVVGDGVSTGTGTPKPTTPTKPTPSPGPKPGIEKPYLADSLVSAKITDTRYLMTMDSDSNLIYFDADQNAILSLNSATRNAKTLLDVAAATTSVTVPAKDDIPEVTKTYSDLKVSQVFWDKVASRLLVIGEFASMKNSGIDDGWDDPGETAKTYSAIFELKNGELTFFAEVPATLGGGYDKWYYNGILCALDNGTFVIDRLNDGYALTSIYDFKKGKDVSYLDKDGRLHRFKHEILIQEGRDLYSVSYNKIYKYNYGSDTWAETGSIYAPHGAGGIHYQNGAFYSWKYGKISATKPNGQQKAILELSVDVDVLDFLGLPDGVNNLFVTQEKQFLFYDNAGKVIRMIYTNPDA